MRKAQPLKTNPVQVVNEGLTGGCACGGGSQFIPTQRPLKAAVCLKLDLREVGHGPEEFSVPPS